MKDCPAIVYVLCLLHVVLGVSAFAGGASLMLAPDGSLLNLKPGLLQHTPFSNYFIPGLLLFLLNGIFSFVIIFGLLFKPDWEIFDQFNIYKEKHGAWAYSLFSGIIILIWIIAQQMMTAYFWLQPVIAIMGLLIIILTMLPEVMKYYTKE